MERRIGLDLLHALQLRAYPSNPKDHAGNGGFSHFQALGNVGYGEGSRRLGSRTEGSLTPKALRGHVERIKDGQAVRWRLVDRK
jgi:hypothetical protein